MTSIKPLVRIAVPADRSFLFEHDRHLRPEMLGGLIDARRILVVERSGVLLGGLRWGLFWDLIPFMNWLFVLEGHRKQGLGSVLMDAWEAEARIAGYEAVMTSSQADETAQHVYRKRGYKDCGVLILPGQAAEVFFRKELDGGAPSG